MDEGEFIRRAEQTLQEIDRRMEASGIDADCEFKGTGVLEIEFANGSKIIVNKQGAAHQIWVAARSGGFHYNYDPATRQWRNDQSGAELFTELSRLTSEQAGTPVALA